MRALAVFAAAVALTGCASEQSYFAVSGVDSWLQAPNNEVDILWVIDDSCSMEEEQATLVAGFTSFVSQLEASGTDFQIGVISTSFDLDDPNRGRLIGNPPYLTIDDKYVSGFVGRATVGITGSDKEKGLEAALYALSPEMTIGGPNDGFLRDEAQLLVVFVSDEQDCSDGGALEGQPAEECYRQEEELTPIGTFIQGFEDLKANPDDVSIGTIVGLHNSVCDDAYPGSRYFQTAALTGGLVGDICLADWSSMMGDLGLTATGIRTTFQTQYIADPATLHVTVDGVEVPENPVIGWEYDASTCTLKFADSAVPPRGSEIVAEYTLQSGVSCGSAAATAGEVF